jgi:hypothetical protein
MPMSHAEQAMTPDKHQLSLARMEEIVSQFNERVRKALATQPASKDLVKKAIRRKRAPRCPVWLNHLSYDIIIRYLFVSSRQCCRIHAACAYKAIVASCAISKILILHVKKPYKKARQKKPGSEERKIARSIPQPHFIRLTQIGCSC